jgi:transcriptional regulator with XRE-family HTH domain
MKIEQQNTDEAVLAELGARLARTRLERNLTQEQLADEAGVARITLARLEAGHAVRTPSLVRVLRTLELLDALDRLIPEPAPSPIERLKLQGQQRQRGSGSRPAQRPEDEDGPWTWGDEPGGDTP